MGCHIWDSILRAFSLSYGGFVTERNIFDAGGESVFNKDSALITATQLGDYFSTPVYDGTQKFMNIKQRLNGSKQEWVVLLPEWLQQQNTM